MILTDVVEERQINTDDYKCIDVAKEDTTKPKSKPDTENDDNDYSDTNNNKMLTVQRGLSQAMIPGSRIIKLEIEQSIHDRVVRTEKP
jgi:hypothetical protein